MSSISVSDPFRVRGKGAVMIPRSISRRLTLARHHIVLAVTASALTACSGIAERAFTRPVLAVRSVKLRSVGLTGGSIEATLTITNPNPYPLPVQRATYLFALADSTEVGRGVTATAFTIPGRDSTVVLLPVDISWQGLRAVARDAARATVRSTIACPASSRSIRRSGIRTCHSSRRAGSHHRQPSCGHSPERPPVARKRTTGAQYTSVGLRCPDS